MRPCEWLPRQLICSSSRVPRLPNQKAFLVGTTVCLSASVFTALRTGYRIIRFAVDLTRGLWQNLIMEQLELAREFWEFLISRKKYWLAPIILVLLLVGLLIVFAEGSAVAPFIYTLF
jgi:Family of unknown function (DUF5989)